MCTSRKEFEQIVRNPRTQAQAQVLGLAAQDWVAAQTGYGVGREELQALKSRITKRAARFGAKTARRIRNAMCV